MPSVQNNFKETFVGHLLNWIQGQKSLSIQFDITNACNLSCRHCYHSNHRNVGALSFEEWQIVLGQYEAMRKKLRLRPAFVLCGGEPLANRNWRDYIEKIRAIHPDAPIRILTNGTLIDTESARFLYEKKCNVQISLDGPTADLHDQVRGKGNFERTLTGVRRLREAGV